MWVSLTQYIYVRYKTVHDEVCLLMVLFAYFLRCILHVVVYVYTYTYI